MHGHDLWNVFALGVAYGQFEEEQAREFVDKYDGFTFEIRGFGSVVAWTPNAVEGICIHSEYAKGGHCGGIKHIDKEDEAVPWGLWFETEEFYKFRDGDSDELRGLDISDQWWRTYMSDDDAIDAALNAEWHVSKFLPKHAATYDKDFRWSRFDNLDDISGFFYTAFYDDRGRVTKARMELNPKTVVISQASYTLPLAAALATLVLSSF